MSDYDSSDCCSYYHERENVKVIKKTHAQRRKTRRPQVNFKQIDQITKGSLPKPKSEILHDGPLDFPDIHFIDESDDEGYIKPDVDKNPDVVNIIHINSVHKMEPRDYNPERGAAIFCSAVKSFHPLDPIILFSGDISAPSKVGTLTKSQQMIVVLNKIGTKCGLMGNRDLNAGSEASTEILEKTNFPWILSNLVLKGSKRKQFQIVQKSGRRIGIIGLVDRDWVEGFTSIHHQDISFTDYVVSGTILSRDLKDDGCDCVIALTSMKMANDVRLAQNVPEIDLILGCYEHSYENKKINNTWIIKCGADFRQFSMVKLNFENNQMEVSFSGIPVSPEDFDEDIDAVKEFKNCPIQAENQGDNNSYYSDGEPVTWVSEATLLKGVLAKRSAKPLFKSPLVTSGTIRFHSEENLMLKQQRQKEFSGMRPTKLRQESSILKNIQRREMIDKVLNFSKLEKREQEEKERLKVEFDIASGLLRTRAILLAPTTSFPTTPQPSPQSMTPTDDDSKEKPFPTLLTSFQHEKPSQRRIVRKIVEAQIYFSPELKQLSETRFSESEFINECLQWHNRYRGIHAAPSLKLDTTLCASAQNWANLLAHKDEFSHQNPKNVGENLFAWPVPVQSGINIAKKKKPEITGKDVAVYWYKTCQNYDFTKHPSLLHSQAAQFSQMVWFSTKKFGCGKARSRSGKLIVVAHYKPKGNLPGLFHLNVFEPEIESEQETILPENHSRTVGKNTKFDSILRCLKT